MALYHNQIKILKRIEATKYRLEGFVIWECALKGKTHRNLNEVIHTAANWIMYDSQSAEIEGKVASF